MRRVVKDAELNAEEDKKIKELVSTRNTAEATIHTVKKSLQEAGDKLPVEEKTNIEKAVEELESAVKTDNRSDIEAKTQNLMTVSQKLGEMMYADKNNGEASSNSTDSSSNNEHKNDKPDDVVDAEFTEEKK